jgi:hypothetical protein
MVLDHWKIIQAWILLAHRKDDAREIIKKFKDCQFF